MPGDQAEVYDLRVLLFADERHLPQIHFEAGQDVLFKSQRLARLPRVLGPLPDLLFPYVEPGNGPAQRLAECPSNPPRSFRCSSDGSLIPEVPLCRAARQAPGCPRARSTGTPTLRRLRLRRRPSGCLAGAPAPTGACSFYARDPGCVELMMPESEAVALPRPPLRTRPYAHRPADPARKAGACPRSSSGGSLAAGCLPEPFATISPPESSTG